MTDPREVTDILRSIQAGRRGAHDELFEAVYARLRELAHGRMLREKPGHMLQTTALVHETYMKLVDDETLRFHNRAHFFGAAAESMRRILVDAARRRNALKHGGGRQRVPISSFDVEGPAEDIDILALHDALQGLERQDARKGKVVKLRFFAGLTEEETAEVLGVTSRTVCNDWNFARMWLRREMSRDNTV